VALAALPTGNTTAGEPPH